MSLASRREIGERLAALYWARKGMRRNPTLMTVCGLNPARKRAPLRSRLGETGRELGGTALRSIVGAAASFAAAPLIKKLAGSAFANPAFRKKFAAFPSERKKICRHTHMPYSGSIPCTGVRRCTMCGATEDQIRRSRRRNPGTVGSALLAGATSAVVGRMLRNPGQTWACDVAVPGVFRGGRGRIFVLASDAADAKRTAQDTLMHDYGMGRVIRVARAGSGLGLKQNPLVRGDQLPFHLKQEVQQAYIYRWTTGNTRRAEVYGVCPHCGVPGGKPGSRIMACRQVHPTIPLQTDEQWMREHAFDVTRAGQLSRSRSHAVPAYMAKSNPCGSRPRANPHCVKCGIRLKPGEGFQGMCSFCVREGNNPGRFRKNSHLEGDPCQMCGGPLGFMGALGNLEHYRCINCGAEFSVQKPQQTSFRSSVKRAHRQARAMRTNPGPTRKTTVPISKFAGWVKSQRNPALMADFRKKVAAYKKWTHGSLPTKVSVEKINSPGLNGMIIATGLGKSPESTYIMPSGSKRGGAWKHKWETMPDMADAGNGLLVTKLRGKSRVTNFFHK